MTLYPADDAAAIRAARERVEEICASDYPNIARLRRLAESDGPIPQRAARCIAATLSYTAAWAVEGDAAGEPSCEWLVEELERLLAGLPPEGIPDTPHLDHLVEAAESAAPIPREVAAAAAETLAQLITTMRVPVGDNGELAETMATAYIMQFAELRLRAELHQRARRRA